MALSLDRCTHWMLVACLFMSILVLLRGVSYQYRQTMSNPDSTSSGLLLVCCLLWLSKTQMPRDFKILSYWWSPATEFSDMCAEKLFFSRTKQLDWFEKQLEHIPKGKWFALLYIHAVDQWCPTLLTFDPFPSFLRGTNRIRFIYSTIESKARIGANLKSVHQTPMRYTLANLLPKERQTWTR